MSTHVCRRSVDLTAGSFRDGRVDPKLQEVPAHLQKLNAAAT
jgi:hypothetical protein